MVLDTKPWRILGVVYAHHHGLPPPRDVDEERGFDVHAHGPLRKPGHHFFARLQRHMNASGHKVPIDGYINAATREVLKPPLTRGEKVAAWELTQLGVHEIPWGSNQGPQVRVYQSSTGAYGLAWCASLQSYGQRKFGYDGPISARAFDWLDFGSHVAPSSAKQGDPVVIKEGDGHIGCFLNVQPDGQIRMVSGNTHNAVDVGDYDPKTAIIVRLYR